MTPPFHSMPSAFTEPARATILVVDDDEDVVRLHQKMLQKRGYDVRAATNLDAAVESMVSGPADIIISDYRLSPDTTGLDLHEALKALGREVPIILVTAFSDAQMAISALRGGIWDLVPKTTGYVDYLPTAVERVLSEVRTQRRLAESESRFQLFMDFSPAIAFVKDEEGRLLYANRRFEEASGACDWAGKTDNELWPRETAQLLREQDAAVLTSDVPIQSTDLLTMSDGARQHWLTLRFPLREVNGRRLIGGMAVDVTQQRVAEATLRERDEQLLRAQRLESLGTLAGGVAHEFNNLLHAILGYTRLVMEDLSPDQPIFQNLDVVVKAAERAAQLTNHLLRFSRRDAIQKELVDANDLVRDTAKLLGPLLGEHIAVELNLGDDTGSLLGDAGQIQQMLMNICINARDAMPSGGKLTVTTRCHELDDALNAPCPEMQPGKYVVLSIRDSGSGMTPEVKKRIFEPFFTTKEVGKGTGLGLAMVYGVVQQHGGGIDVESEPGAGSCFTIYLPAAEGRIHSSQGSQQWTELSGEGTVLVVEDEQLVRDYILRVLERAGYQTIAARDGREAVELFHQHLSHVTLVMMDAVMPRMCGREACRQIRALRADVPILFCTGYDPDGQYQALMPDGDLRMLHKPFGPAELLGEVRLAMGCQVPA